MIESIFDFIYIKTIGVSLLIALILIARPFVLKKMNARLAYQLWLIVPVFLLLPVLQYEDISNGNQLTIYLEKNQVLPTLPSVTEKAPVDMVQAGLFLWLIGFLISLYFYIAGYRRLNSSFKLAAFQPKISLIRKFLPAQRKHPQFVESNIVNSPAVFGLVTPKVILPKDFGLQESEQQEIILSHEFYHIFRGDYLVNHIRSVIRCIFWFNPMIYFADKYFEADQELSCDLGVLESAQSISHKKYATVLLNEAINENRTTLLSQWNYSVLIKERIKMIGKNQNKLWHKVLTSIFAVASVGYANMLVAGNHSSQKEVKPIVIVQSKYPRAAARDKIEGAVKLGFDLTDEGKPTNVVVLGSKPEGVFDNVAKEAFLKWKFDPSSHGRTGLVYTMEYKLSEPKNEAIPTKVFAPKYPKQAADKKIEGSVTFSFDIDENGSPINLKVIESKPKGIFEREAKLAISKWEFKSKSGETKNLNYTMVFELGGELDKSVASLDVLKKEHQSFKAKRQEMVKLINDYAKNNEQTKLKQAKVYVAQLDKLIESVEAEIASVSK